MTEHRKITHEQFKDECRAQNVIREDIAFICPMCGTIQSPRLLMKAKGTDKFEDINKVIGFSCVGRLTGKTSPSEEQGKGHGCNWTLGGLFSTHTLTVVTPDGVEHPSFELATPDQAVDLALSLLSKDPE